MSEVAEYYLTQFRQGKHENAFFGLIEAGKGVLPSLIESFHDEVDSDTREFLVKVIWQHRDPSTVPFLASALNDPQLELWKEAIDGLVTLGTVEAVNALSQAHGWQFASEKESAEFREWLDEAIEQLKHRS